MIVLFAICSYVSKRCARNKVTGFNNFSSFSPKFFIFLYGGYTTFWHPILLSTCRSTTVQRSIYLQLSDSIDRFPIQPKYRLFLHSLFATAI
ncbi:hypothetical protein CANCADRAFT_98223 [Tortispora caseinolytica NRRL Y-17796]|uniref:Uncharacterized protein n=1 Tax=Tortispora caseinolytica NRRL Y-17796 TaxID=767744 RepID=A0A1E4TE52_9ASCO|nr:hypothetical protein CANCADRAFT_98223 [Tortispora caseinolytica NRRL Y-17796]